jgi:hypothetical protein
MKNRNNTIDTIDLIDRISLISKSIKSKKFNNDKIAIKFAKNELKSLKNKLNEKLN